jgi:hypothetical protein
MHGELGKTGESLLRKLEGKRHLERPGDRCEEHIKMDLE